MTVAGDAEACVSGLFHFSEDPAIRVFVPRPVRVAIDRGPDRAWLNDPLVWAIDAVHSRLYLFPRDCPRIVIWPTGETSPEDRRTWFGDVTGRAVAYVEDAWMDRIRSGTLHRYGMPPETFEAMMDAIDDDVLAAIVKSRSGGVPCTEPPSGSPAATA